MRKGLLLFLVVAVAQWGALAWMVRGKEQVLAEGMEYLFKLQPIDPTDPFRGEYVTLNFEAFNATVPLLDTSLTDGAFRGYALLGVGDDGFARVAGVSGEVPLADDYVRVTGYSYPSIDTTGTPGGPRMFSGLEPEFTKFYLAEGGGRVAEDLVRWRPDTVILREAYAVVHVYRGDAVIEDLIIDGRSIQAWIDEARAAADTVTVAAP